MTKHIHWLIPYSKSIQPCTVNLASVRLRLAVAIKLLESDGWLISWGSEILNNPDILVIGKITPELAVNSSNWFDRLNALSENGTKILLDYTDHHLGYQSASSYIYQKLMHIIDGCITSSNHLSSIMANHFNGPRFVIPDAIEVAITPPKIRLPDDSITLLWFGHATNIEYLISLIADWPIGNQPVNLIVLSNKNGLEIFKNHFFNRKINIKIGLYEWSLQSMISAAKVSNLCIIPSNLESMKKSGASSNRLITSLALGLPTAAEMLSSYKEFSSYFVDIRSDEFANLISNPNSYIDIVSAAQKDIVPFFKPDMIAKSWLELLNQVGY